MQAVEKFNGFKSKGYSLFVALARPGRVRAAASSPVVESSPVAEESDCHEKQSMLASPAEFSGEQTGDQFGRTDQSPRSREQSDLISKSNLRCDSVDVDAAISGRGNCVKDPCADVSGPVIGNGPAGSGEFGPKQLVQNSDLAHGTDVLGPGSGSADRAFQPSSSMVVFGPESAGQISQQVAVFDPAGDPLGSPWKEALLKSPIQSNVSAPKRRGRPKKGQSKGIAPPTVIYQTRARTSNDKGGNSGNFIVDIAKKDSSGGWSFSQKIGKKAVDVGFLALQQFNPLDAPHRSEEDDEDNPESSIGKAIIPISVSNRFCCLNSGRTQERRAAF